VSFDLVSQGDIEKFESNELKDEEVVLNEFVHLYQLASIRKVAFEEKSYDTIKKIDSVIYSLITDNLIYQPKFNKKHEKYLIDYISKTKYYQFTWTEKEHKYLLNTLK
jgi:hypothetical protein